jgi:uncharacterized protein (DUF3084 family)
MTKTFITTLSTIVFATSQLNADAANVTSSNQPKTAEELMKELAQLDQQEKELDEKIESAKARTEALDKLEKAVDELSSELGVKE